MRESSRLHADILKRCDIKPYTSFDLLLLCLASIARGNRLAVRVPHLNPPTFHSALSILASFGLIRLDLYDDGFLGIVEQPAVCKYLKPIFKSVACWDIEDWSLSRSVYNTITKMNQINIIRLPMKETGNKWRGEIKKGPASQNFIVEAKYMDYWYLAEFLSLRGNQSSDESRDLIPEYFQHPWEIKRNTKWPNEIKRMILNRDPIERYLTKNLSSSSMLITGMTSTVIWVCELAKKGLLPKFRLALILSDENRKAEFHNSTELASFLDFVTASYHACTRMFLALNRRVILDELDKKI